MWFNHIKEVKMFLKELSDLIKPYNLYCISETAISILDNKIPNNYFIVSDIEISSIYKYFDEVNNIELYPFSFTFKFKDELFFLIKLDEKIDKKNLRKIVDYFDKITLNSLIIPLFYDPYSGTFKNLENCFLFFNNKTAENSKKSLTIYKKVNSRYFEFIKRFFNIDQKDFRYNRLIKNNYYNESNYGIEKETKNLNLPSIYFEKLLENIKQKSNFLQLRISMLFFVLQSIESKILIEELSKTDFFLWFFPLLEKCKIHYQTKEFHPEGTLYDHLILTAMEIDSSDIALKLAAILHDIGKVESINHNAKSYHPKYPNHAKLSANIAKRYLKDISKYLPFYPNLTEKVTFLIENHMKIAYLPDIEEDKRKDILNSNYLPDLLKLLKADLNSSSADLNIYKRVYSYVQKTKF
ncbi:MAG TPA: HD domain-containing protein [Exilispira sp.]|nr:HD domain-containing protein [Exilispira sp.]